jgi:hypothetical protein
MQVKRLELAKDETAETNSTHHRSVLAKIEMRLEQFSQY